MNRLALYAGACAVLMGAGAAGWHWTPWIGPQAQFTAKDKRINDLSDKLKAAQEAVEARDKAIAERDATLAANAAQEASDASQTASFWKGQSRAAFQAGRASCPRSDAGGVRNDLRTLQSAGAYTPGSAGLPSQPESGH